MESQMDRRIQIPFLLVVVLLLFAPGCVTTESLGQKTQTVKIITVPEGAMIRVGTGSDQRLLGPSPQTLTVLYEEKQSTFQRAWWMVPAASAAVVFGGVGVFISRGDIWSGGPGQYIGGVTMMAAGGAAFVASLVACLVLETRDPISEYSPEPREVTLSATLEGYATATAKVVSPGEDNEATIALIPESPPDSPRNPGP
jgi:hypothetical protein